MTVIAVKKCKDSIYVAADQQTTYGHHKITDEKNKVWENGNKVFEENGMTIGAAGSVKEICLFHMFCKNHKPAHVSESGVIEFMTEFMGWAKKKNDKLIFENQYFLIHEDKIFQIIDSLLVKEVKEYASIGSGMFLALGALYYGKTPSEAVEVAKEFDLYCGGKTQTLKIKLNKNETTKN